MIQQKEKSLSVLKGECQTVFNKWIRLRDKDKPCIYCGKPETKADPFDACHYYPISTAEALRFSEANVHGGHRSCNSIDDRDAYAWSMADRVGLITMEEIEPLRHSLMKYSRHEIQELIEHYQAKIKALLKT